MESCTPFALTRERLSLGELTLFDVIAGSLARIRARDDLNAFVTVFEEEALRAARGIDEKIRSGRAGPLAGMIVGVKDNICVCGHRTTCASRMLENYVPPYHATAVERLIAADAIIIGKTNLDEFAMGSSSERSIFGPVLHPRDPARVPGGSSGGSAVAVATGMVHAALGSDTGGSIRQPAAFCGVTGLKPTYGRVSRYGLVAFAPSCDQIGPLAGNVEDVARVLRVISGRDARDATSADVPVPDFTLSPPGDAKNLRVGIPKEYFPASLDAEIAEAVLNGVELLAEAGASVHDVSLPHAEYAVPAYYCISMADTSSNLARFDGVEYGFRRPAETYQEMVTRSRTDGFGEEVKRRIMIGTHILSRGADRDYYLKARQVRRLVARDFEEAFEKVDVIITPTTPTTAFKRGECSKDPVAMFLADVFTVGGNLAGIPAISIPCGVDARGLPIGLQLYARAFDEATLLKAAGFLERSLG